MANNSTFTPFPQHVLDQCFRACQSNCCDVNGTCPLDRNACFYFPPKEERLHPAIIAALIISILALVSVIILTIVYCCRRKREAALAADGSTMHMNAPGHTVHPIAVPAYPNSPNYMAQAPEYAKV